MLITLLTNDEFGKSIALLLGRRFEIEQITLRQGLDRDWSKGECGLVAVCVDRPYHAAFEQLSDRLRKENRPMTFACLDDSMLTIGPLIIPGKSPCYRCFRRRWLCRMVSPWSPAQERVVQAAFDRDWTLKIPGMLPTTPLLAAARLERHALLRESDYGMVTQVSLANAKFQDFRVRAVHGCRCLLSSQAGKETGEPAQLISAVEKLFI